ncbi:MAG: response regulator [Desulfohalobiaceae bacterium]
MNLKILLVDDEEEFITTLSERLELRGYSTDTASDGQQALAMLDATCYDVVMLDLMMPGMSGLEILQQAKRLKPDLPIILLTGHGSTREGIEGMRLGAVDFLMKPLDIVELITKIEEAVRIRE